MKKFAALGFIALVAVSALTFADSSYALGRCRRNCQGGGSQQPPPVVTPPRQPETPKPPPAAEPPSVKVPRPDVSSCGILARGTASGQYFAEIAKGIAGIDAGLNRDGKPFMEKTCSAAPGFLRSTCCVSTSNIVLKGCLDRVDTGSEQNNKCGPMRGKRLQCCSSVRGQVLNILHAYCAQQVKAIAGQCGVVDTPAPEIVTE